jgi:hypothetical protein
MQPSRYTPRAVGSRARKTLRVEMGVLISTIETTAYGVYHLEGIVMLPGMVLKISASFLGSFCHYLAKLLAYKGGGGLPETEIRIYLKPSPRIVRGDRNAKTCFRAKVKFPYNLVTVHLGVLEGLTTYLGIHSYSCSCPNDVAHL